MKFFKVTIATLLISIFFSSNFALAKWGKGELKLSKKTMENLIMYMYGAGNTKYSTSKKKRSNPMMFAVTEDGRGSYYFYCPYAQCKDSGVQSQLIVSCRSTYERECYVLAIKRKIVWKNGGPKLRIKKKDLKTPYIVAKKIQEAGFYDGDISELAGIDMKTGQADEKKKITGDKTSIKTDTGSESSTDLVKQLEDLKKLFNSGVLTEEEFTKAKNKLLNQ